MNGLYFQSVVAKIIFGISKDLTRCLYLGEWWVHIAGYDWSVIDEVQKPAGMLGKNDLLLCTLDGGCKVVVIGLFELLAGLQGSARGIDQHRDSIQYCSVVLQRPGSEPLRERAPARAVLF